VTAEQDLHGSERVGLRDSLLERVVDVVDELILDRVGGSGPAVVERRMQERVGAVAGQQAAEPIVGGERLRQAERHVAADQGVGALDALRRGLHVSRRDAIAVGQTLGVREQVLEAVRLQLAQPCVDQRDEVRGGLGEARVVMRVDPTGVGPPDRRAELGREVAAALGPDPARGERHLGA
jgi:hypothetical protein